MAAKSLRQSFQIREETACSKCAFRELCPVQGLTASQMILENQQSTSLNKMNAAKASAGGDPVEATIADVNIVLFGLYMM